MFKDDNERLQAGVLPTDPAEGTTPTSSWPDFVPLETPSVPCFPVEVLPDWQRALVEAVAVETETSPDLGALATLSVAATALQGKIVVEQRRGFVQPLCLWTMSLLKSGGRKTRVFALATLPLDLWQAQRAQELVATIAAQCSARRRLQHRVASAEKSAAAAKNDEERRTESAAADSLAQELAAFTVMREPVLFITDGTPERIEEMLCEQNGRIAVLSDEGAMLEILSGRYSRGAPQLSSLNSAHEGGAIRVARKRRQDGSSGDRILNHAHVTFGLSVQPERVFSELKKQSAFFESGFAWRFLYALVPSTLGERTHRTETTPLHIRAAYCASMNRLLDIPMPRTETPLIKLTAEAAEALLDWEARVHEPRLRATGELATVVSWGSKLASRLCRIAALFHCAEVGEPPWERPLDLPTMERALLLAPYFIAHVNAVAFELNAEPQLHRARRAVSWLRRERKVSFSQRELHRAVAKTEDASVAERVIQILENHGLVRAVPRVAAIGRPSAEFVVHPKLLG
jgi:hypothetical protein